MTHSESGNQPTPSGKSLFYCGSCQTQIRHTFMANSPLWRLAIGDMVAHLGYKGTKYFEKRCSHSSLNSIRVVNKNHIQICNMKYCCLKNVYFWLNYLGVFNYRLWEQRVLH
ncbi:hypothetical protein FKM82_026551 [Ascaphus truei]